MAEELTDPMGSSSTLLSPEATTTTTTTTAAAAAPTSSINNNNNDDDEDPLSAILDLEETFYAEGLALGRSDGHRAGLVEGRIFGLQTAFTKFERMGRLHGRATVWAARMGMEQGTEGLDVLVGDTAAARGGGVGGEEGEEEAASTELPPPESLIAAFKAHLQVQSNSHTLPLPHFPHLPHLSVPRHDAATAIQQGPSQTRLRNHLRTLWALTEPESLGLENSEEYVAEFDDRLKRAEAKAEIVRRMSGEYGEDGEEETAEEEEGNEKGESKRRRKRTVKAKMQGLSSSSSLLAETAIEDVNILHARH